MKIVKPKYHSIEVDTAKKYGIEFAIVERVIHSMRMNKIESIGNFFCDEFYSNNSQLLESNIPYLSPKRIKECVEFLFELEARK